MTEQEYDNIHNEGYPEGFNPIRDARLAAEAEEIANEPVTIDDLYRRIEAMDNSIARESGCDFTAEIAAARAQIDAIKAEKTAKFLAIWTVEITKARRIANNDFVRSIATPKGVPSRAYQAWLDNQGWQQADLKRAIKLHNL